MSSKIFWAFASVFLLSSAAYGEEISKAGLFVEPAVTYQKGNSDVNYPAPLSNSTGDVAGFGIGARLGFHINEVVFVGFDGRYSMPNFTDSSVQYDAKATAVDWGPTVGIQMPNVGLRIWGSYLMGGTLDPEASGNVDVKFQEGKGYRLGAGFRVSIVSLNLEYQDLKYGQATLQAIGPFNPGTAFDSVNLETKTWIASVSFPLEL